MEPGSDNGHADSYCRLSRRQLLERAAVGGAALSAAGVLFPGNALAARPKRGGVLRVGFGGGGIADSIDAHRFATSLSACRLSQLYDPLVEWDTRFRPRLKLAEEISANRAGTVWTIRLKPGVKFHNGKTAGADELIYTFRRILEPKTGAIDRSLYAGFINPRGMKKLDRRTVRFTMLRPFAIFDTILADSVATHIVPIGYNPKRPVGTGPFSYKSFSPGQESVFLRFADYWGQVAHVDRVVTLDINDDTARVNALLAGQVDAIYPVPPAQIETLRARGAVVQSSATGQWNPLLMNVTAEPFTDVKVRQAMRLIVDRKAMLAQALNGLGIVGHDVFAPFDQDYLKSAWTRDQDIDQAKSLLKQAGKENLSVELTASPVGAGTVESAQVFAQQAKAAGVNVKVTTLDPSTLWATGTGDWAFTVSAWGSYSYLGQAAYNQGPNATWNDTHVHDDQYISLYNQALATTDAKKRRVLVQEMQRVDYTRGGYIIPHFQNVTMAHSRKVSGFPRFDQTGRTLGRASDLNGIYFV